MGKWFVSLAIVLVLLQPSLGAGTPVGLDYVCRYNLVHNAEHLTGVVAVSPTRAVVSGYFGLALLDLDALPVEGTSNALSRVTGLDARNLYLKDSYIFANLHTHNQYGGRPGYADFAAQNAWGFAVVRIDGDKLTFIRVVSEPNVFYEKMCIKGRYLYVAAHNKGIRIFDIRDPEDPVMVGSLTTGFRDAFAIDVEGRLAYVADGVGGLKIVDVAKPSRPRIAWSEDPGSAVGAAQAVRIDGSQVYVALGSAGLGVYHASKPWLREVLDLGGLAEDMCKIGDHLAVAHLNGVSLINAKGNCSPRVVATERATLRGPGGTGFRVSYDVCPLGDDRVLVANWDYVDMYRIRKLSNSTQPNIDCKEQRVRFGTSPGYREVVVTNGGEAPVHISSIESSSPSFIVAATEVTGRRSTPAVFPVTLDRRERLVIGIAYDGAPASGAVNVYSDDPDESPLGIQVYGNTSFLDPGEIAPDFTLPLLSRDPVTGLLDEGSFRLSDYRGKVVVFQVLASWCPASLPALTDFQVTTVKEFEGNPDVKVLFFHEGGKQAESRPWIETYWSNLALNTDVIWDATGQYSRNVFYMPDIPIPFFRVYVIDQDGRVALAHFGYDHELVRDTVYGLLK